MSVQMRIFAVVVCTGVWIGSMGCGRQEGASVAAGGPPVVPVSVAKVTAESVPTELRVVGTVDASSIVQVKSQVAGELLKVAFTEGQNVTAGDLLFEIDPRPFQDALRQAEAAVSRDRAQIKQSEAAAGARRGAGEIRRNGCRPLCRIAESRAWFPSRSTTSRRPTPRSRGKRREPRKRPSPAPGRRSRPTRRRSPRPN